MEDQSSLLQGNVQEDSFEVVMRGYNRRQVDEYVLQCQHHIRDLAQRLALAEQEIERIRAEATVAIEKVAAKPVHEEVSERLAQILRLANEEAERERANAADEIAALRAEALAETRDLREQALQETEELRRQALAEIEAEREQVKAETDALCRRVEAETEALRQDAEQEASQARAQAQAEAERVLSEAQAAAEGDVAQARDEAERLEEAARSESERLRLASQQRADALIGEAERRSNAINNVLGGRLEVLTATHRDVLARLVDLRTFLVDMLDQEEAEGLFEVPPPPAEAAPLPADSYVQTAGEVAAAYEAARGAQTQSLTQRGPLIPAPQLPPIPPAPQLPPVPPAPSSELPGWRSVVLAESTVVPAENTAEIVVEPEPVVLDRPATVTLDEPVEPKAKG